MQGENPFQLKSSREVYKNPWMQVREDSVVRPGGGDGIFGVVLMKSGAAVVALTPQREILLAREYKYAVGRYTLECIGGVVDDGESALDAAKRELKEEAGAEADSWTDLGLTDPFSSVIRSENHIFLAQNVVVVGQQKTDGGEVIALVTIPFAEAVRKVETGEITHAASVIGILKTERLLRG